MINNVRFTFSIGDTTWAIPKYSRQIELVTQNTIYSVVFFKVRVDCNILKSVYLSRTHARSAISYHDV